MENIIIKKVTTGDIPALQRISIQTFTETFSGNNNEANMSSYLNESFSITRLTKELNEPNSQFFFALLENEIIGYLKLNSGSAQTELQDEKALEIERIYVLGAYHGKKVGQRLYDKAIQVAQTTAADYVWLGVWENNQRAIRFYQKNGFVAFDKHIFVLGDDEQTDIMMKKDLRHHG